MTTLSIRLPGALAAKLATESRARRIGQSAIMRELVAKHFNGRVEGRRVARAPKRKEKRSGVTAFDLVGDLAGSVKGGPPDLSTHPKHMEGFGG